MRFCTVLKQKKKKSLLLVIEFKYLGILFPSDNRQVELSCLHPIWPGNALEYPWTRQKLLLGNWISIFLFFPTGLIPLKIICYSTADFWKFSDLLMVNCNIYFTLWYTLFQRKILLCSDWHKGKETLFFKRIPKSDNKNTLYHYRAIWPKSNRNVFNMNLKSTFFLLKVEA